MTETSTNPPAPNVRHEPRFRRLLLSEALLTSLLRTGLGLPGVSAGPVSWNLPVGAEIRAVWEDRARGGFCVSLWHPSFAPVPDGEYAPLFPLVSTKATGGPE